MPLSPPRSPTGFTLIETLVATGILVTVLAGAAQLLAVTLRLAREPGTRGSAVAMAQAKIEWLRACAFAYGPAGEAVTDAALAASPPGALADDVPGYSDWLDAGGREVDGAREGWAWRRRWAITVIDEASPDVVAVEVCVFRAAAGPDAAPEVCLFTLRARQP